MVREKCNKGRKKKRGGGRKSNGQYAIWLNGTIWDYIQIEVIWVTRNNVWRKHDVRHHLVRHETTDQHWQRHLMRKITRVVARTTQKLKVLGHHSVHHLMTINWCSKWYCVLLCTDPTYGYTRDSKFLVLAEKMPVISPYLTRCLFNVRIPYANG